MYIMVMNWKVLFSYLNFQWTSTMHFDPGEGLNKGPNYQVRSSVESCFNILHFACTGIKICSCCCLHICKRMTTILSTPVPWLLLCVWLQFLEGFLSEERMERVIHWVENMKMSHYPFLQPAWLGEIWHFHISLLGVMAHCPSAL